MKRVLITGALGQIGTELTLFLRKELGNEQVLATDLRFNENHPLCQEKNFEVLDVLNEAAFKNIVENFKPTTIIHLAALLSATAEAKPLFAWDLNMKGLLNALELCRTYQIQFFTPSSIAAFGKSSPKINTPQETLQRPSSLYGITKVAGELLMDYYHTRYGVDTRSLRLPGIISSEALPGGGTTDYAVDIYYQALEKGEYTCYLHEDTRLDMMYMPDTLRAIVDLLKADAEHLKHRNAYNVSAMNFTPKEIALSIQKFLPHFKMHYQLDPVRQNIADSWPDSMDCSIAKKEWNFTIQYDLDKMSEDMLQRLSKK